MEQEELFENTLRLRNNPKSMFVSYGWDSTGHREWVYSLVEHLKRHDYEVIIDKDFDLPAEQFIFMATHCRNIFYVVTEKFMDACLMGKARSGQKYSNLPAFSVARDDLDSTDQVADQVIDLGSSALTIWQKFSLDGSKALRRKCLTLPHMTSFPSTTKDGALTKIK